jgi:hypothetical protein
MSYPEMTPVDSTNVEALGYDAKNEQLYVQFLNGGLYLYTGVDQQSYDELREAPSIGSHFNREIKPNFQHEKVG